MANNHIRALERLRADYVDVRRYQVSNRLIPAAQSGDEAQLRALEQRLTEIQKVIAALDEALKDERSQDRSFEEHGPIIG